tara:strand:- start:159 stop:749 length:591 start_codon:yes stop_codon:yes gene_type:complete
MSFWGEKDTSITFCEKPYNKNMFIAEFYNTISGSLYIFVAIPFLKTKINDIAICSIFLGLGTMLLHMTQRIYGQICDELSMLCLCYLILNKINSIKYPKKILFLIIFTYLQNYMNFIYFVSMFTVKIFFIIYECRNIKNKKEKYKRNIFISSMGIGTFLWLLDQHYCNYIVMYHLHAFWHLFTSIGLLSGLSLLKD